MNDIILDHQIIVDKIGTVKTVRMIPRRAPPTRHIVRPLGCKELVHSGLIRQIQFRMRTKQEVRIPFATQIIQDGGATKPR